MPVRIQQGGTEDDRQRLIGDGRIPLQALPPDPHAAYRRQPFLSALTRNAKPSHQIRPMPSILQASVDPPSGWELPGAEDDRTIQRQTSRQAMRLVRSLGLAQYPPGAFKRLKYSEFVLYCPLLSSKQAQRGRGSLRNLPRSADRIMEDGLAAS